MINNTTPPCIRQIGILRFWKSVLTFVERNGFSSSSLCCSSCCSSPKQWPSRLSHILSFHQALSVQKIQFPHKSLLNLTELADGISLVDSRRKLLPSPLWIVRSEGNRRGHSPRGNENISQSSEVSSNTSNQDEIIALFKRIQSSISKSGFTRTKKSSSDNSDNKQSTASVSRGRQTRKPLKAKPSDQEKDKDPTPQEGVPRDQEERAGNNSPREDVVLTRFPSNFLKKSPIPTPSTPKGEVTDVIEEGFPAASKKLLEVEQMKLPELKELARSRGMRGYSKLKKAELVELLKGVT